MNFIHFLLIAMSSMVALAGETEVLSEETYVFNDPMTIGRNTNLTFTQVKLLSTNEQLFNKGALQVRALDNATITLAKFSNDRHRIIKFNGVGSLGVSMKESFLNWAFATFNVNVKDNLMFRFLNRERTFANAGNFNVLADGVVFDFPVELLNRGNMSITAKSMGHISLGRYINHGSHEVEVEAPTSVYCIESLTNTGMFSYQGHRTREHALKKADFAVSIKEGVDNIGIMAFTMDHRGKGAFQSGNYIRNDGLICLNTTYYHQTGEVFGKGCWILEEQAYIQIDGTQSFSQGQSIVLGDAYSFIGIGRLGKSEAVYNVYGFENAEFPIRSQVDIEFISYDERTGFLRISNSDDKCLVFNIGLGFEKDMFQIKSNLVHYDGASRPMRKLPTICDCEMLTPIGQEELLIE